MTATQNGKQQAQVAGASMPMNKFFFQALGTSEASRQFKALRSQQQFVKAWDAQWNELPTAQMPAIRK